MIRNRSAWVLAVLGASALAVVSRADEVKLTVVSSGAMGKIGFYRPIRLHVTPTKPACIRVEPRGLISPVYGVIEFGPREKRANIGVILDEPDGQPAHLYVDSNANGDLTDDPPVNWTSKTHPGADNKEYKMYSGTIVLPLQFNGATQMVNLGVYRFDKNEPSRAGLKEYILFYRDYAVAGEVKLGGTSYRVMLSDEQATGDFRGAPKPSAADDTKLQDTAFNSGVSFLIDVNGNGRFDNRGEIYDISAPFNIKGVTYEITGVDPSGSHLAIKKSARTVAEILPPADLTKGKLALTFERKTIDGNTVSFPASYKGKVVMLDFWATWCGPCMGEVPNLARVYQKYHDKGFEILGVTLDQANALDKIATVTKANNMTWPQVYDGKYWQAEIAQLYAVDSIPHAFLVDGNTGKVIAETSGLRGEALEPTIQKALAAIGK